MKPRNGFWVVLGALATASVGLHCGDASEPSLAPMESPAAPAPGGDAPATTAPAEGPAPGDAPPGDAPRADGAAAESEGAPVTPALDAPGAEAPGGAPAAGAASLSAASSTALAGVLEAAVERGDAPGLVALVVGRDGVLFERAAGRLDVAGGEAMPPDAIFNIASMTKPVTSVAVMILLERGQLGLDDPAGMYLPELAAPLVARFDGSGGYTTAPAAAPVTVRHLLSHTSGIGYSFSNSSVGVLQGDFPGTEEWQLPLLDEPGTRWHYGASTRALGLIVEQLSGQSLEAFFQAEIFQPLGMVDTSFAVPLAERARVPSLHVRGAGGQLQGSPQDGIPATPAPPFTGDGGLYSTAQDYGRFMRLFLNGGELDGVRILSEASIALMGQNQIGDIFVEQQEAANPALTRPFPLGAGSDEFGLGFQLTGSDSGGASRSAGSMAWAGLFNTEFWIDPQRGVAATLLMQVLPFYDEGAIRALQDFETALYRELGAPAD